MNVGGMAYSQGSESVGCDLQVAFFRPDVNHPHQALSSIIAVGRAVSSGTMQEPFSDDIRSRVLFEEDGLIVLDKPAGLPSTGRTLDDPNCAQHLLMTSYKRMIWAVHQLDAQTSGVNLFVRRKSGVDLWAQRLKQQGDKRYVAICKGVIDFDQRIVTHPIDWIPELKRRGVTPKGQSAHSEVQVVARGEDASLVQVKLVTGRTHQIRIHLAAEGHPLLGESRYGTAACDRHYRQALHAMSLRIGEHHFSAPIPEDLIRLSETVRIDLSQLGGF